MRGFINNLQTAEKRTFRPPGAHTRYEIKESGEADYQSICIRVFSTHILVCMSVCLSIRPVSLCIC